MAGGKQGLFETDNFTSPAYVGRLNYEGVPGLRSVVRFTIVPMLPGMLIKSRPIRVSEMLSADLYRRRPIS